MESKNIKGENKIYEVHHCFACGNKIKIDITHVKRGERYGYRCDKCGALADCKRI